jgi:predicted DNA-binding protein with PD1-like motif
LKQGLPSRVIVARFDNGRDVLDDLNELVRQNQVTAGNLTAIGTVQKASVGFFLGDGQYSTVTVDGPLEIVSCVGNVSVKDNQPFVHAHIILADRNGRTYGGHLMPGCLVDATLEVTVQAYDGIDLVRKQDPNTKLFLLDI